MSIRTDVLGTMLEFHTYYNYGTHCLEREEKTSAHITVRAINKKYLQRDKSSKRRFTSA